MGRRAAGDKRADGLTVTVLVPSYRRPEMLLTAWTGCWRAHAGPSRSWWCCATAMPRRTPPWRASGRASGSARGREGGRAGADGGRKREPAAARGDIVALLDDCVPTERWLERLLAHYTAPEVIGVGGEILCTTVTVSPPRPGRWSAALPGAGRIIGNHHQPGFAEPVDVDHLKGANMSFRRAVIPPYDLRLRSGVYHEVDIAFGARAGGGRIVYDPTAAVDHYPAPRWYGHERDSEALSAVADLAHDQAYVMLKHLPRRRRVGFWLFALLIGQHHRYGLLRMIVMLPREGAIAVRRWWAAMRGLFDARTTLRHARQGSRTAVIFTPPNRPTRPGRWGTRRYIARGERLCKSLTSRCGVREAAPARRLRFGGRSVYCGRAGEGRRVAVIHTPKK